MAKLFTYGTLMQGGPAHALFADCITSSRPARTRGRLYALDAGYPALVEGDDAWVYGLLVELREPAPWSRLDAYEDCDPTDPKGSLYHRVQRPVETDDGWVEAWCYVMPADRPPLAPGRGARFIPEGRWSGEVGPT